jgi:hypothetical protein
MSARTCLLCGKPLSRIWVGAGDDFCSREHGNQYRLKLGMNRLTESNKISSLMRRRENPRPITSAHLPLDSASSRRDFPEMKISAAGGTRFPSRAPSSVSSTPRMSPVSGRYVRPRLSRLAGSIARRQPDCSFLRFPARKTTPLAPVRRAELPARIQQSRAKRVGDRILGSGGKQRGFGALPLAGVRAHVEFGGMAPSRIEPPGAASFPNSRHPWKILAPGRTGSMKGLSRGFGFRRPARRGSVCIWPLKARMAVAPLVSAARQFRHVQKTLNCPAAPRAMSRRMATRELVCPPLLARLNPTGIQWPGAARMGRRSPYNGHAPALREWGPLWNVSGLAGFSNARRSLAALDWGMPTPCVVAVPLAPVRSNGAHHVALAPFNPQNSPFGYKEYQEK